tara:strand:- start:15277 stop:15735 length:459 start_codon:yes stop_codon:yes gene_type:complete
MTVQEASGKLYNWFYNHDSFCLDNDFNSIIPMTDLPDRDKAALAIALKKLESGGMLACSEREGEDKKTHDYYVLERSFDSWQQTVDIGPTSARFIANELNSFCELIEDKTDWCDVTSISEKDVRNLVHIIAFYKNKIESEPPEPPKGRRKKS